METVSLYTEKRSLLHPAEQADIYRLNISRRLNRQKRGKLGQFLTPLPIARFMASLFGDAPENVTLLDPGAGTGVLTAAFIREMSSRCIKPFKIKAKLYEIDALMADYLESTLEECTHLGDASNIQIGSAVIQTDFIQWSVEKLLTRGSLFEEKLPPFTHCIINPPYKKIHGSSQHRRLLRQIKIETGNLYSAFLALAVKLLSPGGELVAIVPRSFCNGPYFKPFRQLFLDRMSIRRIHVFDSRSEAFKDDKVLQETIIFHAVKEKKQHKVVISACSGQSFENMTWRITDFDKVVKPGDPDRFIHIAVSEQDQMVVDRISVFSHALSDLGIDVCTGPVVDFRLRPDIRQQAEKGAYPLIYPGHFTNNYIEWPKPRGKKPNAIVENEQSRRRLMENGWYVAVKRFSAKEEKRRLVAALHSPDRVPGEKVGFENHLNIFHHKKNGLEPAIAKGLALYLNSTLLDLFFRQFSGHTQVNATDLRTFHFPDLETLSRLGQHVTDIFPSQQEIDRLLETEIERMAKISKISG